MRSTALSFAAAIFAVGTLGAQAPTPAPKSPADEGLVARKGPYALVWVRPDADITRYSKLYLWEPEFQFRPGGEEHAGTAASRVTEGSGPYAFSPEDQEHFKKLVSDTFVAELERSKMFQLVKELTPGTLIVRAGFMDVISSVPPDANRFDNVHLASLGEATLVFELVDATTGVVQARAAERRYIQPDARMQGVSMAPANSATVWRDVELWAHDRAQDLRDALEKAKKKAEKK